MHARLHARTHRAHLFSEVDNAVGGWLEQHCTAEGDTMKPTKKWQRKNKVQSDRVQTDTRTYTHFLLAYAQYWTVSHPSSLNGTSKVRWL